MQVPSLVAHFSASIYGEIMGIISQFNVLLAPDSSDSLELESNGSRASENAWFSIDASLDAVCLLVNLEDSVADGCTLNLYSQKLGIWYGTFYSLVLCKKNIEIRSAFAYHFTCYSVFVMPGFCLLICKLILIVLL